MPVMKNEWTPYSVFIAICAVLINLGIWAGAIELNRTDVYIGAIWATCGIWNWWYNDIMEG